MKKFSKKGQSTLEYAIVIAVVIAGLLALQSYMGRGVQGKLRQSADDIGEQYATGKTTRDTEIVYQPNVTSDGFGVTTDGTPLQGVSWSKVDTVGAVKQTVTTVNPELGDEKLFDN